jgi:HSP20 family protein
MNVVTWDPFRDINQVFNRYSPNVRNGAEARDKDWSPLVDIYEAGDKFMVRVELPGVDKDGVSVSIDDSVLTIKGTKQFVEAKEGEKWKRVEARYGEFTRRFTLPDEVDEENVSAAYKNGVLELSIPKVEPKKVKMIDVKVH